METYFLPRRRQEIQDLWLQLNLSLSRYINQNNIILYTISVLFSYLSLNLFNLPISKPACAAIKHLRKDCCLEQRQTIRCRSYHRLFDGVGDIINAKKAWSMAKLILGKFRQVYDSHRFAVSNKRDQIKHAFYRTNHKRRY